MRRVVVVLVGVALFVAMVALALLGVGCSYDAPGDGTGQSCARGEVLVAGSPGDPYAYCAPLLEVRTPGDAGADR